MKCKAATFLKCISERLDGYRPILTKKCNAMSSRKWRNWLESSELLSNNSGPLKPSSLLENVLIWCIINCCRIFAWATTHRVLAASGNTRVKQVVAAAAKATSTVPSQAPPLKSATAVLLLLQLLAHWILSRLSSQHVLRLLLVLTGQRCVAVCVLQFHSFFHRMCLSRSKLSSVQMSGPWRRKVEWIQKNTTRYNSL